MIGSTGRWTHLAFVFPAGIGALKQGVTRLFLVRQREEALRHGEGFVDLFLRNPVIDELEKPDLRRCPPKLIRDLGLARVEADQVDARHIASFGCADAAAGVKPTKILPPPVAAQLVPRRGPLAYVLCLSVCMKAFSSGCR